MVGRCYSLSPAARTKRLSVGDDRLGQHAFIADHDLGGGDAQPARNLLGTSLLAQLPQRKGVTQSDGPPDTSASPASIKSSYKALSCPELPLGLDSPGSRELPVARYAEISAYGQPLPQQLPGPVRDSRRGTVPLAGTLILRGTPLTARTFPGVNPAPSLRPTAVTSVGHRARESRCSPGDRQNARLMAPGRRVNAGLNKGEARNDLAPGLRIP